MKAVHLDLRALRAWPLPAIAGDADKEERGKVVVVGGSREIGGAAQLAGVAALRAGAGKLVIATAAPSALHLAQAVPEARVIAIAENEAGSLRAEGAEALRQPLDGAAALLVGPGMMDADGTTAFVERLLAFAGRIPVVLDACAMDVVMRVRQFDTPVLMTPHAGEMAHLTGIAKEDIARDPESVVRRASAQWRAVVALKGSCTFIATPDGQCWRHEAAHAGLATSGSGDVLAGLIAGFAARGAALEQACAWGVVMHALAGRELEREVGAVGYLARELSGKVPKLLARASAGVRRARLSRGS